ncbi:dihydropteroate synthase [Deinococcus depolymerans]|uniref:Dihydropteroate synthase n=1 Tax=Deinococcus depolymerans TaxID=392408 RepID=A0ABP3LX51_9DEIO
MNRLTFGRPAPGTTRTARGWEWRWTGTAVMGILNVTPDSFSDGGRHAALQDALQAARTMQAAGVSVLDIGGESTRPGAHPVAAHEELDRVLPVIRALRDADVLLSVDTMKAEVAAAALRAGAHLINDVTGLRDPEMRRVCADAGAPACLMHMQGKPQTMQLAPHYDDVVTEVHGYLREQAHATLAAGVPDVILDPGIGFGKTLEHNLSLLRALPDLSAGPHPVLIGASRKRLIDLIAQVPDAADRDPGTLALHLHAARSGAALVRAHAAAAHVQALRVQDALTRPALDSGVMPHDTTRNHA